jgi:hypothetical protein
VVFICARSLRMHLSRRRIPAFLHDGFGLDRGIATLNPCLHEAARAVEPGVEEQILAEIAQAGLLPADETGGKEHGRLLWVFTCATATLFVIGRRTQEGLHGVLGRAFDPGLMSDGYWAYRDDDGRLRCRAHRMRKARGLEERLERRAKPFGRHLREGLDPRMAAVYAARESPPAEPLRQQHSARLRTLFEDCVRHAESPHAKTAARARELLNDWDTFWGVLDDPGLPLTHHEAERALRHGVMARRLRYGTRTAQGSRAFTRLARVIDTCRQHHAAPWPSLAEVLRPRRRGAQAPLLPQPAV